MTEWCAVEEEVLQSSQWPSSWGGADILGLDCDCVVSSKEELI